MQIAGSTRSLWEMSFPAACGQLQDLGFDKAELWINDDFGQLTTAEVIQSTESVVAAFRDASRLTAVAIFLESEVNQDDFVHIVNLAKGLKIGQITIPASPLGTPFNSEIDRLKSHYQLCAEEGIRLSILTRTGLISEDPHTAVELCQSVKGLGISLDPTYFVTRPGGPVNFDVVFPHVDHVQLRDSSPTELQVPGGLGEVDYNRIINALRHEGFGRTLSVDLLPKTMDGEERLLEMRKLRLLLETLL